MSRPYHWAQNTVRKMLSNQEYVGDTVNFKTYSKSNKLKKRLKNDPENILIFKDTHEAIIDARPLRWCNGTLPDGNAPTSKARWTSMQDSSSAVNAVSGYICTEGKP